MPGGEQLTRDSLDFVIPVGDVCLAEEAEYCCNGSVIDTKIQMCCGNVARFKTCGDPQCCSSHVYNKDVQICCNDVISSRSSGEEDCCDIYVMDVTRDICCAGNVSVRPLYPNSECCGPEIYDIDTQICCDGVVHDVAMSCCGQDAYDFDTESCCFGEVVLKDSGKNLNKYIEVYGENRGKYSKKKKISRTILKGFQLGVRKGSCVVLLNEFYMQIMAHLLHVFSCIKPRTHSSHNRYLTHIFQRPMHISTVPAPFPIIITLSSDPVPSSNEGVTTQPPSGYFTPDSPTWQWLVFLIFGVASFLLMAGMAIWYCVLRATKTRVTPDDSHGQEKLEEGSTTSLGSKRDGVPPRNYAYNRRDSRKLTIRKWYSLVD
ncbi:hypothetical protein CAPTEDRAFT_199579 [Capitella teleta]|uniref:Galaxin-like repeats domain-containing protein n=1 Tax=Capitella teleta TaxID=283909 RepID=R7TDG4_CAPTE|nr:hypothetical protein CAPTEDRAFT_199579 [Capitella teleta]|eukprot:ELT91547.1 hypothetical protein CAPTEDRAFT_199579 [Capitella teleta]